MSTKKAAPPLEIIWTKKPKYICDSERKTLLVRETELKRRARKVREAKDKYATNTSVKKDDFDLGADDMCDDESFVL